nr:ribonuclease R [uncultured Ligilactobacillus sp.]
MEKQEIINQLYKKFNEEPNKHFTVKQLAEYLNMDKGAQFKFVVQALTQMEHEDQLGFDDDNRFFLKKEMPHFDGIFHANDRGFGFVTVDPEQPDYFINPLNTLSALNGDEVEIQMVTPGDPAHEVRPEGKVVEIKGHALTQVVGEFKNDDESNLPAGIIGTLHLTDKKMTNLQVLVEDKGLHPVPGEVVLADITAYPSSNLPGILKVIPIKVIGNVNDPGVDILQVVYKHDIPTEFPDDVLDEISHIPDYVTEEEKEGRVDLTDQHLVTIDSIESKDLDDAVNVWKLPNGNFHLGVHIADVSHYVTPGSPLDKEAFERGTSVYLTDRVIPMLPHKLSNGICSLNPHVERLAMTCEMEINSEGEVVNHKIFPSIIKSTERMTYIDVNKIVESHDEKTMKRYEELVPMFEDMAELHKILLKMRKRRGAIEFEDDEAKIILDDDGHPIDIQLRNRGTSERMIESFMLAANETVAAHYNNLNVPFVYRIHEQPKEEKITTFLETLSALGIQVTGQKGDVKPKMLQNILKKVVGKPEEAMVSTMLLRSMQQAKYDDHPIGHFGLAATDYTHFTSPIRRYPDLTVHRLIRFYAENGTDEAAQAKYKDKLPEITKHSSEMERRAIDAERETDDLKKAEYMADHVGEEFDAVVSSVTKFGMFISLPNTVEGLIHISELKDDYYVYVEKQMALVGRRYKRTFRIGQEVRVKLMDVNVELHEINFKLLNPKDAPKSDLLKDVELPDMHKRFNRDGKKKNKFNGNKNRRKNNFKRNKDSINGHKRKNQKKNENNRYHH